jgi:hypothetical protein
MAELTYANGRYYDQAGKVWDPFVSVPASQVSQRRVGRTSATYYSFPGVQIPVVENVGRGFTRTVMRDAATAQEISNAGYSFNPQTNTITLPNKTQSGKTVNDLVADQIADQRSTLGTAKYYGGDITAMGGIDAATQYMAGRLVNSGIYNISEIGERPIAEDGVVTGKQIYNKRTGEPLKQGNDAEYYYASNTIAPDGNTYTFGGSFAGGNTSLNITMANGAPVFFTTAGPSSSDFPKELILPAIGIASLMFPGATLAIGNAVAGAVGATVAPAVASAIGAGVLTTVATEGDIKQGLIAAATSLAAGSLASGAEQVGYGGAGDVLASPEVIGGPAGYGGAGSVLSSDELFDAATELSGLTGTDIASTVASAPELSNVVATLEDGASLVSDATGNLSVVDDIAAAGSDMLPLATDFGAEGLAGMGSRPFAGPGVFDTIPQMYFSPESGQVVFGTPAEGLTGFATDLYSPEFVGPRLPQGANVVATLDDGAMLVSDAAGNLSLVDAAGVPEVFDAGTMADLIDTGATSSANTLADAVDAGLIDDLTANTYFDPNRPINVLDDGAISQTFDDGSAIEIDASGNVTVTNATDLADEAVPINREVMLDADLPLGAQSTGPIDADGVPINREITLDATPPSEAAQATGPIDADGVPINREVTLDATPPSDAAQATGPIDADGVPINREVAIESAIDTSRPTTQVFDDGSTLIDTGGNLSATQAPDAGATVVQQFDDGSAIVMDSNGNLSATPAPGGEVNPVISSDAGTLQTFDDGSTFQTFDDGSTLAVDSAGNVSSTNATDVGPAINTGATQIFEDGSTLTTDANGNVTSTPATDGATLQDVAQTQGTVQTFDDGSTLQTFDDGSTIATDADGNVVTSTATDVSPFQIGISPEPSLTDKLLDAGQSVVDYVTSNPLTTAALLAGATGLVGGEKQEPEPQEPVKKTYTYGEAPAVSYAGLPELFSAASTIYGPQEAYAPPTVRRQELQNVDFGPLLSGRAPGAGLRSLVKTLPTPTGIDISQLTPEQRAQLEQVIAQGGV